MLPVLPQLLGAPWPSLMQRERILQPAGHVFFSLNALEALNDFFVEIPVTQKGPPASPALLVGSRPGMMRRHLLIPLSRVCTSLSCI